jgi:multidrug efflux pump subunit AcrA (membrane-fusion protein)
LASAEGNSLIPGATVTTTIPVQGQRAGVVLPSSAVVWWSGKPWIYRAKDQTHFYRQLVQHYTSVQNKWVVHQGLSPGDPVVVQGAELLLSQEFQSQFAEE